MKKTKPIYIFFVRKIQECINILGEKTRGERERERERERGRAVGKGKGGARNSLAEKPSSQGDSLSHTKHSPSTLNQSINRSINQLINQVSCSYRCSLLL
ncbi:hypothetical protein L1987_83801 [Smallanthus sonchifolius]|uniref:Uncharacterized protein n=1 Tax=Smallanthus sonchifolius TaxID=185202 RepID=A0ACB8YDK6_9ASTR|nr:hypothetical protein L1987_83801 [Smallanthus sonchifolius]